MCFHLSFYSCFSFTSSHFAFSEENFYLGLDMEKAPYSISNYRVSISNNCRSFAYTDIYVCV